MPEHIDFCQKHLTFSGMMAKLNTRVTYEPAQHWIGGILIKVTADTLCILSGKPETVTGHRIVVPDSLLISPLIDQVFEIARHMLLHELAEGFAYDGKPAINPHDYRDVEL